MVDTESWLSRNQQVGRGSRWLGIAARWVCGSYNIKATSPVFHQLLALATRKKEKVTVCSVRGARLCHSLVTAYNFAFHNAANISGVPLMYETVNRHFLKYKGISIYWSSISRVFYVPDTTPTLFLVFATSIWKIYCFWLSEDMGVVQKAKYSYPRKSAVHWMLTNIFIIF